MCATLRISTICQNEVVILFDIAIQIIITVK